MSSPQQGDKLREGDPADQGEQPSVCPTCQGTNRMARRYVRLPYHGSDYVEATHETTLCPNPFHRVAEPTTSENS